VVSKSEVNNWQPWARERGIPDKPEQVTAYFLDTGPDGNGPSIVGGVFTLGPSGVVTFDGEEESAMASFLTEGVGGPDQHRLFYPNDGVDFLRAILLRNRTSSYWSYISTPAPITPAQP
jgi:hypothetical protein